MKKLIGHLEVQNQLAQLFQSGKLPHAIMLQGAKGVGKRLLAEVFARRLLCGPAPTGLIAEEGLTYDENHELYPQIEAVSTPDYILITPEEGKKSISVELVRQSLKKLAFSSDGRRVVIVDAADEMNNNAANALLKTLEEPGQGVHIVLITHNVSKILPTIISRCRQFKVNHLTDAEVEQVLKIELPEKSPVEIDKLVELAGGCPGEALRLGDESAQVLDKVDLYLKNANTLKALELAEELHKKKLAPMALDLLLERIALQAKQQKEKAFHWAEIYKKLNERRTEMEIYNLNPQLVLETSLIDVIPLATK